MSTHYHMLSGDKGMMPDQNQLHKNHEDAVDAMEDFKSSCEDVCELWVERVYPDADDIYHDSCFYGGITDDYFEFTFGHGVEYVEVTECEESECWTYNENLL